MEGLNLAKLYKETKKSWEGKPTQNKGLIECCICGKQHEMGGVRVDYKKRKIYHTEQIMKIAAGPIWDRKYCCADHTDFEITVWKAATNRLVTKKDKEMLDGLKWSGSKSLPKE